MNIVRSLVCLVLALLLVDSISLGCEWDYPIWIPRDSTADPLYRFVSGRRMGYIDQTGKVIVPPTLPFWGGNYGDEFHDGLLEIGVSDGVYVDTRGKKVIGKKFFRGWDFSEGLAVAMENDGGKWGYINTKRPVCHKPEIRIVVNGLRVALRRWLRESRG